MDNVLLRVIDENWLTTLVTIVTSSYIFLLGVPMLIAQTFLPEEIRELYSKRPTTQKEVLKIRKLGIWALVYAVCAYFFNITFPYCFISKEPVEYIHNGKLIFILVYSAFIFSLSVYAFFLYQYLSKQLFYSNPRTNLINAIVEEAKAQYDKSGRISRDDISDLETMGKALNAGLKKGELLKGIMTLVSHILDSEKTKYDGDKLEAIIRDVLGESFCHTNDSSNEANLKAALIICERIKESNELENEMKYVDTKALIEVVYKITNIAIEKNYETIFTKSSNILRSVRRTHRLPQNAMNLNRISHKCFENGDYVFVTQEISEFCTFIEEGKRDTHYIYTMLHYISRFYIGDEHMQDYSRKKYEKIKEMLDENHISDAIKHFRDNKNYEAASRINMFRRRYFQEPNV
jgi:hypothetical protein